VQDYHILIAGDTSVSDLAAIVEPLIDEERTLTEHGYTYGPGIYAVTDSEMGGLAYVDNGLPLSQFRFEVFTRAFDAEAWIRRVYGMLERDTGCRLLLLRGLTEVLAQRP